VANSKRFDYTPPSYEDMQERADRKGSLFDNLFKDVKIYAAKQGANALRILPPTFKNNPKRHFGLEIFIHYGVGPQDQRYLCLKENASSPYDRCPVCEALYELGSRASKEDKYQLLPKRSYIYYVIDRDAEKDGIYVYMASGSTDSEIASQCINHRTKSLVNIVDPDDGYDIEFTRQGTGRNNTRYRGFKVSRDPSPLSDNTRRVDDWLDEISERPLDTILNFYTPERIEEVFYGKPKEESRRRRDDDDDDRPSTQGRRFSRDEDDGDDDAGPSRRRVVQEEDRPLQRRRAQDDDDEPRRLTSRRDADNEDSGPEERQSSRSRSRGADNDDDGGDSDRRSARSRREDDEERPAARSRERERDRGGDEEPRDKPPRTKLSEELDDEIPFEDGRRARGRGVEDEEREDRASRRATNGHDREEASARGNSRREEQAAEERPQPRNRERLRDEEEEQPRGRRGSNRDDDDNERSERLKARLASRE